MFVEEESLSYLAPLATLAIGVLAPMDALLDAYRAGGGVPTRPTAPTRVRGSRRSTVRCLSTSSRAGSPPSPTLSERTPCAETDRSVRVRGSRVRGWMVEHSAIARAYPGVIVDAIDSDMDSIEDARRTVAFAGMCAAARCDRRSETRATRNSGAGLTW